MIYIPSDEFSLSSNSGLEELAISQSVLCLGLMIGDRAWRTPGIGIDWPLNLILLSDCVLVIFRWLGSELSNPTEMKYTIYQALSFNTKENIILLLKTNGKRLYNYTIIALPWVRHEVLWNTEKQQQCYLSSKFIFNPTAVFEISILFELFNNYVKWANFMLEICREMRKQGGV